jgi:hypothetical protein
MVVRGDRQYRTVVQARGVALITSALGDHRHAGAQQRRQTVGDPARIPRILQPRGQSVAQRSAFQRFAPQQKPGIAGEFLGPCLHPHCPVAQRPEKL